MPDLPIDEIPNSCPPQFRWRQSVNTSDGHVVMTMEGGMLTVGQEAAVRQLIEMYKFSAYECAKLKKENAELRGKMMEQSNLHRNPPPSGTVVTTINPHVSSKKGKG